MWFTNENPALRACWHPVAYRRELDEAGGGPLRVELLGEAWALAVVDGAVAVVRDECAHRLAPLSAGEVVDGCFRCPYHGWSWDTEGTLVDVPALGPGAALPSRWRLDRPAAVAERYGIVWLAPEPPVTPLPEVPEAEDPALTPVPLPAWEWEASAGQMADNFLDVAHFPFLHLGTFGDPDDREVAPYEVERDGWTFTVAHRHSTKAPADAESAGPADGFAVEERGNRFVFTAPHHVRLRIDYEAEGLVHAIAFFHQPVDATRTRVFRIDIRNDIGPGGTRAEDAAAYAVAVGEEDRVLLEQMRHKGVPLGPGAEANTRADRITVEMRRVLRDLVARTGAPLAERPPTTGPWRPRPPAQPAAGPVPGTGPAPGARPVPPRVPA